MDDYVPIYDWMSGEVRYFDKKWIEETAKRINSLLSKDKDEEDSK